MLKKSEGPWVLKDVKTRLRLEQVAREKEASERYRQQEERDTDEGKAISGEVTKGKSSWSHCVLVLLALSCFVLSLLSVLLLWIDIFFS